MALKTVLDSIDDLPDALKPEYTERDSKFYLTVDGIDSHPDVVGLAKKKDDLLSDQRKLKDKLKAFEGLDPEKAREALAAAETAAEEGLISKGDVETLKTTYEERLEKQTKESQLKIDKAVEAAAKDSDAARRYFSSAEISRAISDAGGEPALLEPVVGGMTSVEVSDEGDFMLKVLDATGTPRIKDAQGTPFGVSDLLEELRSDDRYGRAFDGSGNAGSGAKGGQKGGGGAGSKRRIPRSRIGDPGNLEAIAKGEAIAVDD